MALRTDEFIQRANNMINSAHGFAGWILLKERPIIDLLDRLNGAIPEDIKEAERILRRREDIINAANYDAERIRNDALNEKNRILSDSELLRAVQEEAAVVREKLIAECEEIKDKAYSDAENIKIQASEEARRMREGAEAYVEQILANLDENLNQQLTVVHNGQRYMEQRKMEIQRSMGYEQGSSSQDYQQNVENNEVYQKV